MLRCTEDNLRRYSGKYPRTVSITIRFFEKEPVAFVETNETVSFVIDIDVDASRGIAQIFPGDPQNVPGSD